MQCPASPCSVRCESKQGFKKTPCVGSMKSTTDSRFPGEPAPSQDTIYAGHTYDHAHTRSGISRPRARRGPVSPGRRVRSYFCACCTPLSRSDGGSCASLAKQVYARAYVAPNIPRTGGRCDLALKKKTNTQKCPKLKSDSFELL